MNKKSKVRFLVPGTILVSALTVIFLCLFTDLGSQVKLSSLFQEDQTDMPEKIQLLLEREEKVETGTLYQILVTNDSDYEFHKVEIKISHPLRMQSGTMHNENYYSSNKTLEVFKAHSSERVKIIIPFSASEEDSVVPEKVEVKFSGFLKGLSSQKLERIGSLK